MTEGVVGQPGQTGKKDAGIGDAFDGKGVEIGCPRRGPRLGRRFEDPLLRPAHMLEKDQAALSRSRAPHELGGDLGRRGAVMRKQ